MRFLYLAAVLAAAAVHAQPDQQREPETQDPQEPWVIKGRALPNSPTGGYAPRVVDCPSRRPTVRSADGLSAEEAAWLVSRRRNTVKPMADFLNRAGIQNFNAVDYITKIQGNVAALPNIALAFSGGGYRALMNGAGFIKAADERTPGSTDKGGIGGLLQSATYISGLSGGGWLVGSVFNNNFSTIGDLQNNPRIWQFNRSIFVGPTASRKAVTKLFDTATYWRDIVEEVDEKADAGFTTSLTDYWGRALSYQLIDDMDGGDNYLFSSIARSDHFQKANTPFPLIVADGRKPDSLIISLNSTVFEFNPFELGSWDPTVNGFAPLDYVASNFTNGVIPPNGKCVRGFDSSSFVMGTSSSLFNEILLRIQSNKTTETKLPESIVKIIKGIGRKVINNNNDIAAWRPNPFLGFHNSTAGSIAVSDELSLVDGGLDRQNIPLQPLIQPARQVDVIYAIDSSADTSHHWPNGSSMIATFERSRSAMSKGTPFPAVPDRDSFVNLGLNNRPTFFGCDASNFSLPNGAKPPPVVVYIPNAPYSVESNVSTFTMSYAKEKRDAIIANAYNGATQGNGALDSEWPACVACAALQRSMLRTGTPFPAQCQACFKRYCWDGRTDPRPRTSDSYQPSLKLGAQQQGNDQNKSGSGKLTVHHSSGVVAMTLATLATILTLL